MKTCASCFYEAQDDMKFCPKCGHAFDGQQPGAPQAAPVPVGEGQFAQQPAQGQPGQAYPQGAAPAEGAGGQVKSAAKKAGKVLGGFFGDVKDAVVDVVHNPGQLNPSKWEGGQQQGTPPPTNYGQQPPPPAGQAGYPVGQPASGGPAPMAPAPAGETLGQPLPPLQPSSGAQEDLPPLPPLQPSSAGVGPETPPSAAPQPAAAPMAAMPQQAAPQPQPAGGQPGVPAAAPPAQPYGGGAGQQAPQAAQPPYPPQQPPAAPQMAAQTQAHDVGMNGFESRTWSGGSITTPNGITETVVMQSKAELSNRHNPSIQRGNFVLTPTRIIWFKHGEAKGWLLGDWAHLTQGSYAFEIPLTYIHSLHINDLALWKYDTVYTYDGEANTFCFNALNHDNFVAHFQALIPQVLQVRHDLYEEYRPNISPTDPRNPMSPRYDPNWPRGYKVAWHGDKATITAAVADAKAAGILEEDFVLPDVPMEQLIIPPGIPVILSLVPTGQAAQGGAPGPAPNQGTPPVPGQ